MYEAKEKCTPRYRKQTSGYWWGELNRAGAKQGCGIKRYKLLCIKQISTRIHCTAQGIKPLSYNNF